MKHDSAETAKIFLSYERSDQVAVERLYHMLKGAGHDPWLDKYDILPGERWREAIQKAVAKCDFFLACVSKKSIDKRGVLQTEIRYALKHFEEKLAGDIFLIPVRLEEVDLPEQLADIQWVDWFAKDGWNRLRKAIESQGFPGIDKAPTPAQDRWKAVRSLRQPIFDLITPSYILDNTFHFLDWNPTFDELVAKPMGLRRGEHGLEFIRQLANCAEVIERSKEVFGAEQDPLVDIELLQFESDTYGIVLFQKIASQISDEEGNPMAWCVNLNVLVSERMQQLWGDLKQRLERDVNWTRYAVSYDKLLRPFDDYRELVDLIVQQVGDAQRCVDLGAGTGNGTLRLLESDLTRQVWAVESNEAMLEYLREKIRALEEGNSFLDSWTGGELYQQSHLDRLTVVKDDILRMEDLPANYFDAAVLINVLYTVDDPRSCLKQAARLLRPGGVLVLSTPHQQTDVDRLLAKLREVLERKNCFEELRFNFEAVQRAHEKLMPNIHRDSKEDIREYVCSSGFEIEDESRDWHDDEYVGSVVVVRAVLK